MNISGIVLNPAASQLLDELIASPTQAVLLAGPAGIGKSHIARNTAMALLQVDNLENQPYLREVTPEKGSISIDQVRVLIRFFRLRVPGAAAVKRVAIIQDAETMGREAQNALLKLLEEPPEGSVLILASSQPDQLLPTIRSRVQILMLPAPDQAALIQHFATLGLPEAVVSKTLLRTGTNIAEAARLLDGQSTAADEPLELVKKVLTGTSFDRMLLVDGMAKQKEQAAAFVETLAATASASLQAAAGKNPAAIPRWQAILQAAITAGDALDKNGNTKLVLSELMLAL
ncbi:MAG TPA: AAA family ATPase [Candidatus Saccharimonadales bacterium]|nr:AAA family ATPase [Candidatus Saccharimonadales bacterium]